MSSNNPEVTINAIDSSISELNLNVIVSESSQIGQTTLTLTDIFGNSANVEITIVNQQVFVNTPQTKLLWHLDESGNGSAGIIDSSNSSINWNGIEQFAGG